MHKIVFLPHGPKNAIEEINNLLENEWRIREMHTVSTSEEFGCFVWLEKLENDAKTSELAKGEN